MGALTGAPTPHWAWEHPPFTGHGGLLCTHCGNGCLQGQDVHAGQDGPQLLWPCKQYCGRANSTVAVQTVLWLCRQWLCKQYCGCANSTVAVQTVLWLCKQYCSCANSTVAVQTVLWLCKQYCGCANSTVAVQTVLWLCKQYCGCALTAATDVCNARMCTRGRMASLTRPKSSLGTSAMERRRVSSCRRGSASSKARISMGSRYAVITPGEACTGNSNTGGPEHMEYTQGRSASWHPCPCEQAPPTMYHSSRGAGCAARKLPGLDEGPGRGTAESALEASRRHLLKSC